MIRASVDEIGVRALRRAQCLEGKALRERSAGTTADAAWRASKRLGWVWESHMLFSASAAVNHWKYLSSGATLEEARAANHPWGPRARRFMIRAERYRQWRSLRGTVPEIVDA